MCVCTLFITPFTFLSLLLRVSLESLTTTTLAWFIIQPDIDRVGPKSPSDSHPALFSSFSRKFKISRAARISWYWGVMTPPTSGSRMVPP